MKDQSKTKAMLVSELEEMRRRLTKLIKGEDFEKPLNKTLSDNDAIFQFLFRDRFGVCLHELVYSDDNEVTDYRVLDVNQKYIEITGLKQENVINELASKVYGTDPSPFLETYAEVVQQGKPVQFETYFPPMDKWFSTSVFCPGSDQFVTVSEEITDRKRAAEALRESRQLLSNVFESMQEGVLVLGSDFKYTYWNRSMEEISGMKRKEVLGTIPWEKFPFLKGGIEKAMKDAMEGHTSLNIDLNYTSADEKKGWTRESYFPLKDSDGQIGGVVGVIEDTTERKQAEEERILMMEQYHMAQKMESVGRLAGGVAHDLNNLLSPILGYGEILLEDLSPGDTRHGSVEEILQAGFRARDLVRQLLAFSRKQTLEYRPLDLNEVLGGFEKLLRRTVREDVRLEIIPSPDIQTILGDNTQVEQVIMNLAVNAADAMLGGGKLTIETAQAELDESYASTHQGVQPGAYVMLAVSDTGCGMDEGTREQIFEPFFSTKGKSGTGLGLATVYGIIKQHGGNIWVYSEIGKGTTFKVYLPVSKGVHREVTASQKGVIESKGSETILVVEDDEQLRNLAGAMLLRFGYRVLLATDGADALRTLASHGNLVHLLLTDVVMPGMNGKELFVRGNEMQPGLKVLYMSGYTENVIVDQGVLEDGIVLIQKPFTLQALASKIREVLDQ